MNDSYVPFTHPLPFSPALGTDPHPHPDAAAHPAAEHPRLSHRRSAVGGRVLDHPQTVEAVGPEAAPTR